MSLDEFKGIFGGNIFIDYWDVLLDWYFLFLCYIFLYRKELIGL